MGQVRTIQYGESLDAVWEELVYTEARLLGDALTHDLASDFTELLATVESVRSGQYKVWRDEIVAQAGVDQVNSVLDRTTTSFGAKLLAAVNGDRKNPRWRRYFSDTVSAIVRLALGKQIERTRAWPVSLKGETEDELRAFAPKFAKHIEDGDKALQARVEASARRADHRVRDIVTLIDDANALRTRALGRLLQRSVKADLPRDWAEGFFRRAQRTSAADSEDGGGATDTGSASEPDATATPASGKTPRSP